MGISVIGRRSLREVTDLPVATSGDEQHGVLDGTGGLASAGPTSHKARLTWSDRLRPVFL